MSVDRLPGKVPVYDVATDSGTIIVGGVVAAQCDAMRYGIISARKQSGKPSDLEEREPDATEALMGRGANEVTNVLDDLL